jgi:hypothetical protein
MFCIVLCMSLLRKYVRRSQQFRWRVVTRGKPEPQEESKAETSEKKERWHTDRLFGTNSIKEGAVWLILPLLGNGLVNTFPRLRSQQQNRCPLIDDGLLTHSSLGTYPPQRTIATETKHVYTATDKHGITWTVEDSVLHSVRTEV